MYPNTLSPEAIDLIGRFLVEVSESMHIYIYINVSHVVVLLETSAHIYVFLIFWCTYIYVCMHIGLSSKVRCNNQWWGEWLQSIKITSILFIEPIPMGWDRYEHIPVHPQWALSFTNGKGMSLKIYYDLFWLFVFCGFEWFINVYLLKKSISNNFFRGHKGINKI